MEINNFSEFPEGIFLDYFLNRISKEEFKSTFEAPFLAKELYSLDNLYNLLRYSLFNDTTNQAEAHLLLLGAKTITETITLKSYGIQTISIKEILPDYIIQSFHCNPIQQTTPSLMAIAIRNPQSPETSIDVLPILRENSLDATGTMEIIIFAMQKNTTEDIVYKLLMDAFAYCSQKDFRYAIVAAHNAYELSAKKYFSEFASQSPLNEQAKNFFKNFDRESISSISTKYLPIITSLNGKPMPPKEILNNILKLTKLRNNLSHKLANPTKDDIDMISDCTLSAFLICKYFELSIPHKNYPAESFYSTMKKTSQESTPISVWK